MTRASRPHTPAQRTTRAKRALSSNTPCVTMDYAFTTYTKFAFCITDPCFRYKTILFDYPLAIPCCLRWRVLRAAARRRDHQQDMTRRPSRDPAGGSAHASCCQKTRPPAGRGGEAGRGASMDSAHARLTGVFAITLPYPVSGWLPQSQYKQ